MARKADQNKSAMIPALNPTEIEALQLAAQGYTADRIAQTMQIAPRTATRYIHRALKKLLTRWPSTLNEESPPIKKSTPEPWNRILTRKAGESRIKAYIKRAQLQPHSSWAYIYILIMNSTFQPYRQPPLLEGDIPQHVRESDMVIHWDDHEWVIFLPAATKDEAEAVTRRMAGERSVHIPLGIGWSVSGLHDDVTDAIQTARRLALENYAQVVFYSTSHKRIPPR